MEVFIGKTSIDDRRRIFYFPCLITGGYTYEMAMLIGNAMINHDKPMSSVPPRNSKQWKALSGRWYIKVDMVQTLGRELVEMDVGVQSLPTTTVNQRDSHIFTGNLAEINDNGSVG